VAEAIAPGQPQQDDPMRTPTRRGRVRTENGHAWNLRKRCRFCGLAREFFNQNGRPECQGAKSKPKDATDEKPAQ
jgi:hypothetical protein